MKKELPKRAAFMVAHLKAKSDENLLWVFGHRKTPAQSIGEISDIQFVVGRLGDEAFLGRLIEIKNHFIGLQEINNAQEAQNDKHK